MSYSVHVGGLVTFPSLPDAESWAESEFFENTHDDWGDQFGCDGEGGWVVRQFLTDSVWASDTFIRYRFEGGVLRVAAELPEDFVNDNLRSIAALVRSTAAFGGQGILDAISLDGGDQSDRLVVGNAESKLTVCDDEALGTGAHFTPIDEDLPGDFPVAKKSAAKRDGKKSPIKEDKKADSAAHAPLRYEDLSAAVRARVESGEFDLDRRGLKDLPNDLFEHCPAGQRFVALEENQLRAIPSSIGRLQQLEALHAQSNRLESLPESLAQCSRLTTLDIAFNPGLRDLGATYSLAKLRELDARECGLTTIGPEIGKLRVLQRLSLDDNRLETVDEGLFTLTRLLSLSLERCGLSTLSVRVAELEKLEVLELDGNSLKSLPDLRPLKRLKVLSLSGCPLGELPPAVVDLSCLEILRVSNCQLKALPRDLGQLKNLRVLEAENNRLTALPDSIGMLEGLERLNLKKNKIALLPRSISRLGRLRSELVLDGNPLPGLGKKKGPVAPSVDELLAAQMQQGLESRKSTKTSALQRSGRRRDMAEAQTAGEIGALGDSELVSYGIELAEVDVYRASFERQKGCYAFVVNQLKKRELWEGLRQVVRAQLECLDAVRDFALAGTVAVKTKDHPMAEFLMAEYQGVAKDTVPAAASAAMADVAKLLGRELT